MSIILSIHEEVDAKYYEVKSGSTIITLMRPFLERLPTDEHTITVTYTDGEVSGAFTIRPQSSSPETGDKFNIILHGSMAIMSLAALMVLLLADRKRKQETA